MNTETLSTLRSGSGLRAEGGLRCATATEDGPELDEKTGEKVKEAFEKNWNVIVWNDPINLMSYVVWV